MKCSPANETGPSVSSSRVMTSSASPSRLTGRDRSMPSGAVFRPSPEPSPSTKRPGASSLSVAAACAMVAGWRRYVSVTAMPTRGRRVAMSATVAATKGSE